MPSLHEIQQLADEYAKLKGLGALEHNVAPTPVNTERASRIAQAFETMPHNPNDPEVRRAYDALINETADQFKELKKAGLKVSPITSDMQNPYKSSKDVFNDLNENHHLWYYPTEQGFGSGQIQDHPLLKTVDVDGQKMPANDIFRIVHDYFGHAKEGYSFGPKGEEAAWRAHMQMYSPEAQKALTTETRGQNSWVNYGPKGEINRSNPTTTTYAEQKAGILPDWAFDKSAIAGAALGAGALGGERSTAESISPLRPIGSAIDYYKSNIERPIDDASEAVARKLVEGISPLTGESKQQFVDQNAPIVGMGINPTNYIPYAPETSLGTDAFQRLRDMLNK